MLHLCQRKNLLFDFILFFIFPLEKYTIRIHSYSSNLASTSAHFTGQPPKHFTFRLATYYSTSLSPGSWAILSPVDGAWPSCTKSKGRGSFAWSFRSLGPRFQVFAQVPVAQPPTSSSYPTMRACSIPVTLLVFPLLCELGLEPKHIPGSLKSLHQIGQRLIF